MPEETALTVHIAIEWAAGPRLGTVDVRHGHLLDGRVVRGEGTFSGNRFACPGGDSCRLALTVAAERLAPGAHATIVTILDTTAPFSFFVRDVSADHPILIRPYQVAVTTASDNRSFAEIVAAIETRGLVTELQRINLEPEETFDQAAAFARSLRCPIWLGVGRDMRLFEMDLRGGPGIDLERRMVDWILPRDAGQPVGLPETGGEPCAYGFLLGRGWGYREQISRGLDGDVLPIFRATLVDDHVRYDLTAFATLEDRDLTHRGPRGTHFLVADGHCVGHRFTPEQEARFATFLASEAERPETTVLCARIEAVNSAPVPRYAFFKAPFPAKRTVAHEFDGDEGFVRFSADRVFAIARLNGSALPQHEVAVLVPPGSSVLFEFVLPHRPVPAERARALSQWNLLERLEDCRAYWRGKLDASGRIHVPEQRINQMIQAGLLHLDLVTYGLEPEGPLAAAVGIYSPIGSESAPIIQIFDSFGRHDLSRRALACFLEKQHPDGFMQNFDSYEIEVGCVLWTIGEHYRVTRDDRWAADIAPQVLKACNFLLTWRARNQREDLRRRGYGMIDGQVGDPVDRERSFMLNGYAYLGLSRAAELLATCEPEASCRLAREAEALRNDIRAAFFQVLAESPVVPLGDGSWCPTAAPWAGHRGPKALYADGGTWYTHGAITPRDSLTGPLYLVLQEVIAPDEPCVEALLAFHNELFCSDNVAFCQPYYSPHPYVHLRRGEIKPFLRAYYRTMAAVADRETYTFWEHYFLWGPHKTHEEAWFLMQTRWLLYLEEVDTLALLRGVPRAWLEDGKRIELDRVASRFGPISLHVESAVGQGRITAQIVCDGVHRPRAIEIRLPHPLGRKAVRVQGADYDPGNETARIDPFSGKATIVATFEIQ